MKRKYAYENFSLEDIPGEQWKAVPGFENLYEISSFDRIKSLPKERMLYNGGLVKTKERILKPTVRKEFNSIANDSKYTLWISLAHGKGRKRISIGRMVYYTFLEFFDLENRSLLVSYKDGNGLNVEISNLCLVAGQQLSQQAYELMRNKSPLSFLSKRISQFDLEGSFIQRFPSIYQASKVTQLKTASIANALVGKTKQSGGFVWQMGKRNVLSKAKLARVKKNVSESKSFSLINIYLKANLNFPIFNLSIADLVGETWREIPGFEGRYSISNLGRVKSLPRMTNGSRRQWITEMIRKCTIPVKLTGDNQEKSIAPFIVLRRGNLSKTISIARWVYYLFVERFDIGNSFNQINYKDKNCLNIHPDNLILKNIKTGKRKLQQIRIE